MFYSKKNFQSLWTETNKKYSTCFWSVINFVVTHFTDTKKKKLKSFI